MNIPYLVTKNKVVLDDYDFDYGLIPLIGWLIVTVYLLRGVLDSQYPGTLLIVEFIILSSSPICWTLAGKETNNLILIFAYKYSIWILKFLKWCIPCLLVLCLLYFVYLKSGWSTINSIIIVVLVLELIYLLLNRR